MVAFELHDGAARDDAELADGGEVGGELVGHNLAKNLAGVAGVVIEGKHG